LPHLVCHLEHIAWMTNQEPVVEDTGKTAGIFLKKYWSSSTHSSSLWASYRFPSYIGNIDKDLLEGNRSIIVLFIYFFSKILSAFNEHWTNQAMSKCGFILHICLLYRTSCKLYMHIMYNVYHLCMSCEYNIMHTHACLMLQKNYTVSFVLVDILNKNTCFFFKFW